MYIPLDNKALLTGRYAHVMSLEKPRWSSAGESLYAVWDIVAVNGLL